MQDRLGVDFTQSDLAIRQFSVGQSNPTYLLTAGERRWVLRKKPPGDLLPSAHQVEREYRVMAALSRSAVPVPNMVLLEEDPAVLGTTFYIMDFVAGRSLRDPRLLELDQTERGPIHLSLIETLAKLHNTDLDMAGLKDFGRSDGYIERQIARWTKQYQSSKTHDISELDELIAWLPDNLPDSAKQTPATIVHGDFRLDNTIIAHDRPEVVAVLDWELSTIGHPCSDLAYTLMAFDTPSTGGVFPALYGEDLAVIGVPSFDRLVDHYCAIRGIPRPDDLGYYQAFSFFRMSAILQGIAARAEQGNATGKNAKLMGSLADHFAKVGWAKARSVG